MVHALHTKRNACRLRRQGLSIPGIARRLGVSKSTVSLWVRHVAVPEHLAIILQEKGRKAHELGRAARLSHIQKATEDDAKSSVKDLGTLPRTKSFARIIAALLYWCEGGKKHLASGIRFTNSDPELIETFLTAMRSGFNLDPQRLRVMVHVHEYHNPVTQIAFWSSVTGIPVQQFYRPYRKSNTGKRTRLNYQGCVTVHYPDARLARHLDILYHSFAKTYCKKEGA